MRVVCVNARKTWDGQILSCREGKVYTVLRRKVLDDGRPMVQVRGPGCSGEGVFSWFLESRFEPHNDDRRLLLCL